MENPKYTRYTIKKMAEISGVSTRTLRYYDELGLLKPESINESGYRLYGQKQVDTLQQILFYRELGMRLEEIRKIIGDPDFNLLKALQLHRENLLKERGRLDKLIANVEKTILYKKGELKMTDIEKFEGFKQSLIDENEKKYGREIREKYGEEAVERGAGDTGLVGDVVDRDLLEPPTLRARLRSAEDARFDDGGCRGHEVRH